MKNTGKCWVCNKDVSQETVSLNDYHHFDGMNICKSHLGAKEWWENLLKLSNLKLAYLTGFNPEEDNEENYLK